LQLLWIALTLLAALPAALYAQGSAGGGENTERSRPDGGITSETFWDFKLKGIGGFFPASYNRVDGLLVGWGFKLSTAEAITYPGSKTRQLVPAYSYPEFSFELLVPSARRFVGGSLQIKQRLSDPKQIDLGLDLACGSFSSDTWREADPGAGLQYLFLGRDRRYYHDLRGGEVFLAGSHGSGLSLRLGFYHEYVKSLETAGVWTLSSSRLLKENPPVVSGTDRGLRLKVELKRLAEWTFFPEGWYCAAALEAGGPAGGDFDYRLYDFSAGYFRRLGLQNYLSAGLKAVTSDRRLPPHKLYSLGAVIRGIETFDREFDLFDRRGDRLWYLLLGYRRLVTVPDIFINRMVYNLSLDIYFTSGVTFFSLDERDPWTLFTHGLERLESGAGAGLSFTLSRTRVGVYLEKSLNRRYDGPGVFIRLARGR